MSRRHPLWSTLHRQIASRMFLLAGLATLLGATLSATSVSAEMKKVTKVEGITEYQLDNGLQVLLFPDASKPNFTVNITYRVGSRHEGRGEAGMAHLLEHMVFKGTPTNTNIWGALEDHGASFNGTTWLDRTNYYETMPSSEENIRFALEMEADRMINSDIAQEELDKEMSVVRNEFESGENNPQAILGQRMISSAFLWHNYRKSTIGNRSDIERVPATSLKRFYRKYYQPDNASLLVAGKFDEKFVLNLIDEKFGSIPRPTRRLENTYTEEPAQDGDRLVHLYRTGDVATVGLVYHIPPGPHEDFAAVQVFEDMLTNQPAGRLYRGLVASGLSPSVGGYAFPLAEPGVIQIMAEVGEDKSPEEVLGTMTEIIETFGESKVDEEAVKLAVARQIKSIKLAMRDSKRIGIRMSESIAQGDWRLFFIHRDRLEKVTVDDVKRVASEYFIEANRTAGIFVPTDEPQRVTIPRVSDIAAIVDGYEGRGEISKGEELKPDIAYIEGRIKRSQLDDGIKLAILPMETRGDSVRASFRFHYGTEKDLVGRTTAAALVSTMLMRGTERLDYEALRNEIDGLESQISVGGGGGGHPGSLGGAPGNFSASIQSDRERLVDSIKLLGEILKTPSFKEEEFEIVKTQLRTNIEQGMSDPQTLGMLELSRSLRPWPKDSIHYVMTLEEQLKELEATTLDDVKAIYKEFYAANNVEIGIVGDFDPAEIEPLLKQTLGDWKNSKPYERIVRPYRKATAADLVVDTPDKSMAMVAMATAIPMRDDDDDYPAMVMGGYVLGQSAKSRLMNRLRHKGGLSYGAGGSVSASSEDERGSLMGYAICAPQNAEKAQAALKEEIMKWIDEGITEQELAEAQNSYELKFKSTVTSDSFLLGQLTSGLRLDRTLEFRGDLIEKIKKLKPEDVQAALKRTFGDKEMVTMRAGDPDPKAAPDPDKSLDKPEADSNPDDPWAKLVTLDGNKNGKLERSEVPAQLKAAFEQIDANKDGSLDEAEIRKVLSPQPQ